MRAVAYYRVSTSEQGRSGLGLEAQKTAVKDYIWRNGAILVAEFTEVESGKLNSRTQLQAALKHARLTKSTLIVAKLDRLSRSMLDFVSIVERARKHGWSLISLDLNLDTSTGQFHGSSSNRIR